jgi:hypothetical protein
MSSKRTVAATSRPHGRPETSVAKWITLCLSSPNPQTRRKPVIPALAESGSIGEKDKRPVPMPR